MKSSIYNNIINWSGDFDIVFNTLSLRSLILKKGLSMQEVAKDEIKRIEFERNGFLLEDNIDEFEIVSKDFIKKATDKTTFRLTINPTLHYNFKCWYCYENHSGDLRMGIEKRDSLFKVMENLSSKYQNLEISFFGGEPLLEFHTVVKPLMIYSNQKNLFKRDNITFSFTTNGFLITDEMVDFMRDFRISFMQITLDGGEKSHNETRQSSTKNSFLTIIDNIRKLANASINVIVRINLTLDNIDGAFNIPNYFSEFTSKEREFISFSLQQVWQDGSNDIMDKIVRLSQAIVDKGYKLFPGHISRHNQLCYGDKCESAVINYNGNIYKCRAIDFDKFDSEGIINNDCLEIDNYHFKKRQDLWESECKTCRVFPLCCGGCAKTLINKGAAPTCPYPDETMKDKMVMRAFKETFLLYELSMEMQNQKEVSEK